MKKLLSVLPWVIAVLAVVTAAPSIGRYYITHVSVSGISDSPFDSYLAKNLFTIEEADALKYAKTYADGELAIERNATITQLLNTYRAKNTEKGRSGALADWHGSKISSFSVCSENNKSVCIELTSDNNVAYLTGVREAANQRCDVTLSYAGNRANVGRNGAYTTANAVTFYGPRSVGSRQAMAIIQNSNQFLINYVCEFGSYGTYSFKPSTPLNTGK